MTAEQVVNAAANRAWEPPVSMGVAEWSDTHRQLSLPEPGPYRTERTPYVRGIMDCLSPSHPAKHIVWMKGSQIGATEVGICWLGFKIHHAPAPMIVTLPSETTAKEWSEQRVAQLIQDTPVLHGRIADNKRKGSGDTTFLKKIKGTSATIKFAWSTSAKKLRSTPAQDLLSDEVDGFVGDADGEGDPLSLLDARNTNFPLGKHYKVSTPSESPSRIEREFLRGDQRYYFVPCPHCGHFQVIQQKRILWPKKVQGETQVEMLERYSQAKLYCLSCGDGIEHRYKTQMLERGIWVATANYRELLETGFAADKVKSLEKIFTAMSRAIFASFHMSSLYSPVGWFSWADFAEKKELSTRDAKVLKSVVNLCYGEPWVEAGEVLEAQRLYDRREDYPVGIVPPGGLILLATVDVQGDRLEVEIAARGRRGQRWSIYYEVIQPFRQNARGEMVPCRTTDPEPWERLAEILGKDWPCATGGWLPIRVMGIDARHHGDMVYAFARRFPQPRYGSNAIAVVADRTVVPINGEPGWEKAIDGVSSVEASKKRHGMRILHVGTGFTKQTVYNALNLHAPRHGEDYPDGYYHYPDYDLEFFEGLTAEMRHVTAGGSVKWSKKQGQERNEPLDLAGYEVAMAEICQIFRYREQNWQAIEERLAELGKAIEEGTAPKMADGSEMAAKITRQVAEPAKRRETPDAVVRSSWMQNFLGG